MSERALGTAGDCKEVGSPAAPAATSFELVRECRTRMQSTISVSPREILQLGGATLGNTPD